MSLWVRLHRSRTGIRQSARLQCAAAHGWCRWPALGIPLYPKALGRTRAKRHQAGLPFEQRLANVAGAFRVTDTELVEGRKVLLVDDVITTGATAAACTQALLAAGAESVFAIALATVEFEMFPARDQPLQENEPDF
ncbi:MAG: ComF family protein [Faecalibacterium prausnitzii]